MKIKVPEATANQLDWLVAKCEGVIVEGMNILRTNLCDSGNNWVVYCPSSVWSQGGEIIDRENISIIRCAGIDDDNKPIPVWGATSGIKYYSARIGYSEEYYEIGTSDVVYGQTALIAAMRCYILAKLGHEVEIPDTIK